MANGQTNPSRVGLKEGGSDNDALFLKKFSGEILQTFEESNILSLCTQSELLRTVNPLNSQ